MRVATTTPSRSTLWGFSLIEVLVALAVLSIGLLGLAALQTTGLKFNHQSYERTQAVLQAYDIIDRMRANKSGTGGTINTAYNSVALGNLPTISQYCTTASTCTGDQLALFDIRSWNATNASVLSEGRGAICKGNFTNVNNEPTGCTPGGSIYSVAITWRENDLKSRLDMETQP